MGILPDWLIQRDIKIEPFAEGKSRPGTISFGTTSYGYDVRVGRKFKVFTNARCAVVDPKHFDPASFVDIEGDYCLIPPNSFALAETVEYFEIPRDILAVCCGKSTYARCFRADTRVALVDGTAPTLEEMAQRAERGENFWGYSIGRDGRLLVTLLEAPRFIGRDGLVEIVLDNNASIFCTPDHGFLRRDGRMAPADTLRPGDSLMPLYRDRSRGCELVYQPLGGRQTPTHQLAEEWNQRYHRPENITRVAGGAPQETGPIHPATRPRARKRSAGRRFPELLSAFRGQGQLRNHKVRALRSVGGTHDVYCLTVPEAGNFALEAGVFVHNCGIIVNVTPLEPEWRGRITIEISNTTPLPAKIYAGEGIAQILFFRGEAVCRTSYADKKGKYQDQKGLTLPFVTGPNQPQ
jgi:deoxycytidine triphosphate deaminase